MTPHSTPKNQGNAPIRQVTAGKVSLLDDPARFGKFWVKILVALFVLFYLVPELDLAVARQFYLGDGKFSFSDSPSLIFIHQNINFVLWAGMAAIFVVGLSRLALKYATWHQVRRQWLMTILAAIIGPGLIANVLFKDMWGRARPLQIFEFGGALKFTHPMIISDQCSSNCAFVGGDAALGFWLFIFAFMTVASRQVKGTSPLLVLHPAAAGVGPGEKGARSVAYNVGGLSHEQLWRYVLLGLALVVGAGVGLIRIGQGAHFLSDIVFAGWFMLGVSYAIAQLCDPQYTIRSQAKKGWQWFDQWLCSFRNEIFKPRTGIQVQGLRRKAPAIFIVIMLVMMVVDIPLSHLTHQLSGDARHFFGTLSNIAKGIWYLVGMPLLAMLLLSLALIARIFKKTKIERHFVNWVGIPVMIWLAVVLSGLVTNVLKFILARFRPDLYFMQDAEKAQIGLSYFSHLHSHNSFPSGHTTTAVAVATCLWLIWPRGWAVFLAFGLGAGFLRVLAGVHWPSDVVAGGFIGYA
ncbi:MAG: phosphatase PAP2 family protein, partial [Alphaproteobacteria bacterium]|nr:phosphatase PAP2 family protein [Alphaproteobacteria bacterium]